MEAALRGCYVEFVVFKGFNETYPTWLAEEIYCSDFFDDSRFTIWKHRDERSVDYHEKAVVDEDSVFIRKSDGSIFVTGLDLFTRLYTTFHYNSVTNIGVAAFDDDCIEYVECIGGVFNDEYPDWFYEYFSEVVNFPYVETAYVRDETHSSSNKYPLIEVLNSVVLMSTDHCVFIRNKFGEIKSMGYDNFLKYYDPDAKMEDY